MLLSLLLPTFCAVAVSTVNGMSLSVVMPGPTACFAPSGLRGDCVLPKDCPAGRGPPTRSPCGYDWGEMALLFCCERQHTRPLVMTTTPGPSSRTLPTDCGLGHGVRGVAVRNIVNGDTSKRNSWPWAAVIGFVQPDGGVLWQCTGVLVNTHHVLTAAHCLVRGEVLAVRLGEHDLAAAADPARQDRRVRRRVRHPHYRGSKNDLALLELDEPVRLGKAVQPICLPEPEQPAVGRAGYVVGWGNLRFNAEVDERPTLQEALVMVENATECEKRYKPTGKYNRDFPGGFDGAVLCAADPLPQVHDGVLQAADACRGDSGGPLSMQRRDGRYYLAALVLKGIGCGSTVYPGLYTRIALYVDWIRGEVARS